MPLSDEQNELLTEYLQVLGAERAGLNPASRSFVDETVKRHEEYGADIRLSPKQWKWLTDLYEKATDV